MNFRTQIKLKETQNQINYQSDILLFGSCFSNNIGDKLTYFKFKTSKNPFGIIFQPKAIEKLIFKCLDDAIFTEDDLIFHNERWHCFDIHSDFSHFDKTVILTQLNSVLKRTKEQLLKASHIVITLGTAWVYRNKNQNTLVANCHKIPLKEFEKELLSIDKITASLKNITEKIHGINSNCEIIFTLSPVRHLKDGFIENQQSKAHLLSAIHEVIKLQITTHYFPSYEIMLDDLRDYRFYKKDLLHPNELAIDYIWEKFSKVWINEEVKNIMQKVSKIQNGLNHKPFNPNSEQHKLFLKKMRFKMDVLNRDFNISFV